MKKNFRFEILAFCVGIVLPVVLFSVAEKIYTARTPEKATVPTSTRETFYSPVIVEKTDSVQVLSENGTIRNMDMNTYLTGVLLGELPANFEEDTLKAQAVVARTYAKKRSQTGNKHPNGAVCMVASCCQAYCSPEAYLQKGGKQETVEKFRNAVNDTAGMILTYQSDLIDATYFSCSGGRTEDAMAVWGTDVPYLQAVDSPGEENAAHHTDQIKMTAKDFASRLGIELQGSPTTWFGEVTYTPGGGVDTVAISGIRFTGVELRKKLNLYSTAFSMMAVGENIHIYTKGFGHRVGMSQYGAEAMAVSGKNYKEILFHYYPGTSLDCYLD